MPLKLAASLMLTNFSSNVAALRKGLGFSQEDLAQKLKVARTTISNWEKGVAYPSFADLLQLALTLDTTMDELVGARTKEKRPAVKKDLFDPEVDGHPNIVLLDHAAVETLPAHVDLGMRFKGMPAFRLPERPFASGLFICETGAWRNIRPQLIIPGHGAMPRRFVSSPFGALATSSVTAK